MKNIAVLLFGIALVVLLQEAINAATVVVQVGPDADRIFSPAIQNISVGDTVTWIWESNNHNVVSGSSCTPDDIFTSGPDLNNEGYSFSFQFNNAGTFPYYCRPHCLLGMVGGIVVSDSPVTPSPTPAPYPDAPTAYNGEFTLYNSASSFSLGSLASSSATSFLLLSFPDPSTIQFTNVVPGQFLSTPGSIQYNFSASTVTITSFLFVALAGNVISNVATVTLTLIPTSTTTTSTTTTSTSSSSGGHTPTTTEYATTTSNGTTATTKDPDQEFNSFVMRIGFIVLICVGAFIVIGIFFVFIRYKMKRRNYTKIKEESFVR